MNCAEFRSRLLADPRASTPESLAHAGACPACAQLARETLEFESHLHEAMRIPAPEGLAHRVLSRATKRPHAIGHWALAASLIVAVTAGIVLYRDSLEPAESVVAASTLDASHPAVAAIAYVVRYEQPLLDSGHSGDPAVTREVLRELGLRLPADSVTVRYLGKCPVPPGASGEHVVLQGRAFSASLILVPGPGISSRIVVTGQNRIAVASPAHSGGYILVTDSLDRLRQVEKWLM